MKNAGPRLRLVAGARIAAIVVAILLLITACGPGLASRIDVAIPPGQAVKTPPDEVRRATAMFLVGQQRLTGRNLPSPAIVGMRLLGPGEVLPMNAGVVGPNDAIWVVEVSGPTVIDERTIVDRAILTVPDSTGEGSGWPQITGIFAAPARQ